VIPSIDWRAWRLGPIDTRSCQALRPVARPGIDLPRLSDDEFAVLLESVRAHGVRDPLLITPDGGVVDGQARLRAARLAEIAEVPVRVLDAPSPEAWTLYGGLALLGRRHLSSPQRFVLARRLLGLAEQLARHPRRLWPAPRPLPGPADGDGPAAALARARTTVAAHLGAASALATEELVALRHALAGHVAACRRLLETADTALAERATAAQSTHEG
jgi:hypothetical protein